MTQIWRTEPSMFGMGIPERTESYIMGRRKHNDFN